MRRRVYGYHHMLGYVIIKLSKESRRVFALYHPLLLDGLFLFCSLSTVRSGAFFPVHPRREAERYHNVSVIHYQSVSRNKHSLHYPHGGIMLSLPSCGLYIDHLGRLLKWTGRLFSQNVACAVRLSLTLSNTTAYPAHRSTHFIPETNAWRYLSVPG